MVDFLPKLVPSESAGQFPAIERHYLEPANRIPILRSCAEILLKLTCYFDLLVVRVGRDGLPDGEMDGVLNPKPDELVEWVVRDAAHVDALIPSEDALLETRGDDLYMTVYNPSHELLDLIRPLAQANGLFLWQPIQGG